MASLNLPSSSFQQYIRPFYNRGPLENENSNEYSVSGEIGKSITLSLQHMLNQNFTVLECCH